MFWREDPCMQLTIRFGVALLGAVLLLQGGRAMAWELTSPAFAAEERIPARYTCDGADVSPPLRWNDPPAGTRSLALIADDPDAPAGTWVHWVVYRIPAASRRLDEAVPATAELGDGTRQGINDFRRIGYGGPCPPSGTHRYFFRLYALDTVPEVEAGATKTRLLEAVKGHVLAETLLVGRYRRR